MTEQLIPVRMFEEGYTDLISVIPPNGTLSPESRITPDQVGKVPGRRLPNGLWAGYAWRTHAATIDDVRSWAQGGANIGLRAGKFPGVDIDCLDESLAREIEQLAWTILGPAPVRIGRAPKRLLMYAARNPMTRMRLYIEQPVEREIDGQKVKDKQTHLVELLGEGQQFLVYGVHPVTKMPYKWYDRDRAIAIPPKASTLEGLSLAKVNAFFDAVAAAMTAHGLTIHREGDGRNRSAATVEQGSLKAPSDEELAVCVQVIPNTDDIFPGREEFIKFGHAIRAACHDPHAGYTVFAEWCARHAKDGRVSGNAETWETNWRRFRPPFRVGWDYLAALGRNHGYNNAPDEFSTDGEGPPPSTAASSDGGNPNPQRQTVRLSEQWLAREVVRRIGDRLRFVPATGRWLVWDGHVWKHDEIKRAMTEVKEVLHEIASDIMTRAGTPPPKDAISICQRVESHRTLADVLKLIQADRSIAVPVKAIDADPLILNTPSGIVNLKTGALGPADPAKLCTKISVVPPDSNTGMPEWRRFLAEATAGNAELEDYLQRFAGYCLTGQTIEQIVMFVWGPGGCGKGTFVNTIREVMGDYATTAAMEVFHASTFSQHSTDLADLMGARLVTAAETEQGRRWNEQRVKVLSGGDPVKCRFMRQDNFVYIPQFKLLFLGNYKPEIRDVDTAMKRRIRMVPFTTEPAQRDLELSAKLVAEYPAILAWMIDGCVKWRARGMQFAPEVVETETAEYFEESDAIGRWLEECTERKQEATLTSELYESWREWCGSTGEFVGTMKRLVTNLKARRFRRQLEGETRRSQFFGLALKPLNRLVNDLPPLGPKP